MRVQTITPAELVHLRTQGQPVEIIDVRTPAEFHEIRADTARLFPLDALNPRSIMEARTGKADDPLYLICRSGGRSHVAAEQFMAAGYPNVVNVLGGTMAWEKLGLPVLRGERKTISLERQVRIVAGSLVLVGAVLGAFVHPAFIALAAFIGAGFLFSGITDTCGMGMLLARMPWNRA
jgi:rhodanese-related sulfurtransferase